MSEQIKSFEEAVNGVYGDILSVENKKKDVKIGVITCGYFEYWRMYPENLEKNVKSDMKKIVDKLKAKYPNVVCPEFVDTLDSADRAGKELAREQVDMLIVIGATYVADFISLHAINHVKNVPLLLFSTQLEPVLDPKGDYEHSLRNSGVIGIAQLTGTLRKMNRDYEIVVGSANDERAYKKIDTFIQAASAIATLNDSNIGIIGHVFRGMYDLELSKTFLKSKFGVNIINIQSEHVLNEWKTIEDAEVDEQAKKLTNRFKVRNVTEADIKHAVKLGIAMKNIAIKFHLDAMCFLDQHFLQKQTKTTARIGASLLMEQEDITVCSEGDICGLITMMLMRYLSGEHALMAEWGEFDVEKNACLLMGHGIGVPQLAASDDKVTLTRTPEEWGFEGAGLNYELILKPGDATISHIIETTNGYKMIVSPVESVDYPTLQYDELHALAKVKAPVRDYMETIFASGVTHHCIIGSTDMAEELKMIAKMLGLECLYVE